ncbi:histidine phosphatase family protein [Actinospongicola halichondriae]|uniref:histidine phosphatase family protein n=1 Tax=Actinospongicola halichondriae TaxID=3236844 RepID=UPI003D49416C
MAAKRTTRSKRAPSGDSTPAPTLVLLVRHGKTPTTGSVLPGRAPGLHLAEDGIAQAEAVAGRIAELHTSRTTKDGGKGIAAVYASPMERTQETAKPISKALGLRTRTRAGLVECDFGAWTGEKLSKLNKLPEWKTVQRHPAGFRFPNGESFSEMQTRMVDTINALVGEHPGESIVAVSHADTIKAAVAQALGTPLDLFQRIVIGQCSVSAIVYSASGPTVLAVNHTGDLVSLVPS